MTEAAVPMTTPPANGAEPDAGDRRRSRDEPERFTAVYDRHFRAVHGYLAGRLGPEHADDLAAETFLVAFRRRRTFDPARGSVRGRLFGVATKLAAQHRRTETRRLRAPDPDELRKAVLAAVPARMGSRDDRLWLGGTALVTSAPATSEVRRAAYAMLAGLPDVKSLGTVTDRLGRRGIGVAHIGKAIPNVDDNVPGDREYRLIINPDTGQALATETRLPQPTGEAGSLNPGVLWRYTLIKSAGWADDMGPGPDSIARD